MGGRATVDATCTCAHLQLGLSGQELVDDLELLDGQGEQVDLLQLAQLGLLNQTAKLGAGNPFLLFGLTLTLALTLAFALASTTSETLAFLCRKKGYASNRHLMCRSVRDTSSRPSQRVDL